MPTIVNDDKRIDACAEITRDLDTLRILNDMLSMQDVSIQVVATTPNTKGSSKVTLGTKDAAKVVEMLTAYRNRLRKGCIAKAEKFVLEFTEDEQACLSGTNFVPEPRKRRRKGSTEQKGEDDNAATMTGSSDSADTEDHIPLADDEPQSAETADFPAVDSEHP